MAQKRPKSRTQEQLKRGGELIDALCVLFRPFVEAACRPKLEAELAKPLQFDPEAIKNAGEAIKEMPPDLPAELRDGVEKMVEAMKDPKPLTADEIAATIAEETNNETVQLVRNWLNTFFYADDDDDILWTCAIAHIDDAMLPPLGLVLNYGLDGQTGEQLFAECCGQGILDAAETRAVLRQVRATLPAGSVLPADAVAYLALESVVIAP